MARNELAVIEGRWFEKKNRSVRPVFDTLIDLMHGTPHAYFHHHFADAAGLAPIIKHVAARPETRFLYLGAHGNKEGIYGSLGDDDGKVSRVQLRNVLYKCWDEGVGSFDGLFLGSCSFVDEDNAAFLLCGEKAPLSLKWLAGYAKDVDWIDSTLLDALFLRRVLEDDGPPVTRVKAAAARISEEAPGLCKHLGFQVYVRKPGGVKPLVEY